MSSWRVARSAFGAELGAQFFARDVIRVARLLVGAVVTHRSEAGVRAVRIVETEAYKGPDDDACHARFGITPRTKPLFGPPGTVYVFRIYGMYDCLNFTCGREGAGWAVLLRAGEPLSAPAGTRASGPGLLSRALGVGRESSGTNVTSGPIRVHARPRAPRIEATPRIGVGYAGSMAELPWRFVDADSPHVSRPARGLIGLGRPRT